MDNSCLLCGRQTNIRSRKKTADGFLCPECYYSLPQTVKDGLHRYTKDALENIADYARGYTPGYARKFAETSSYGSLHIDELNGLIAICGKKQLDRQGHIVGICRDVYNCLDITDISVTLNIRSAAGNKVVCDAEFRCILDNPPVDIKTVIKKGVRCDCRKEGSGMISCVEPIDLIMFRQLFNQMVRSYAEKFDSSLNQHFLSKKDVELFKARSLFMLEDNYSIEDLKKQRNRLIKAFHPDSELPGQTAEEGPELLKYSSIINNAYRLLEKEMHQA